MGNPADRKLAVGAVSYSDALELLRHEDQCACQRAIVLASLLFAGAMRGCISRSVARHGCRSMV